MKTNVSEKRIASILRVEEQAKQEASNKQEACIIFRP
jgi:hypothetical protein